MNAFLRGVWRKKRRENQKLSFTNRRRIRYPKEPWVSQELTDVVDALEKTYSSQRISSSIYANLIRKCTHERAFSFGVRVHRHMDATKYLRDTYMGNLLIKFYGKCGNVEWACDVFEAMDNRNVFTWNTYLGLLAENNMHRKVYRGFRRMQTQGGLPDCTSYTHAIRACGQLRYLQEGIAFHHELIDTKIEQDHVLQSALIFMYGKCGRLDLAEQVFADVRFKEAASWNAMIIALCRFGLFPRALGLYREMVLEGKQPDKITYSNVLEICLHIRDLSYARSIVERIVSTGYDRTCSKKLLHALAKVYAESRMFERGKEILNVTAKLDISPWNSCISIYVNQGLNTEALELYQAMRARGTNPDNETYKKAFAACSSPEFLSQGKRIHARAIATLVKHKPGLLAAIVKMYSDCGSLNDAKLVFETRKTKSIRPWNAMLAAYVKHGEFTECLKLYEVMRKEVRPDDESHHSVLVACVNAFADEESLVYHVLGRFRLKRRFGLKRMSFRMQSDVLNMYGIRGDFQNAKILFDLMQYRDGSSWNALALACLNGGGTEGIREILWGMQLEGFLPEQEFQRFII